MSAWTRIGALLDRLGDVLVAVSAVLLLAMLALLGVEIASRGLLRTSTQIADEYSGYLFTWITLCCFVYAQRSDRFLRVDSLRARLSPRRRASADALASLLAAALTAILAFSTAGTFHNSVLFNTTSLQPSQTPLYLPQLVMPLGLLVLTFAFVHAGVTSLLQALGRLPVAVDVDGKQASYE